ncbi:DedA family protein [Planobispora siamensis]|uniref:VTT domain-containing protein n=1 Tax=Planobispora siamensis TaxID=936338 RepID=A0A8J3WQ11_9ACTN|nr:VTT domain-containing protein [Planobispora siamensis]GIH96302.1 hypothetical protein Psi01_69320 [Planobispora siamensis]
MLGALNDLLAGLLDLLAGQGFLVVGAALLALLAMEGSLLIGLLVPADAAILMAGIASEGPAEVAGVVVAGVAGCYLGASGGYLIGRMYGTRLRRGRAGRWVGARRWERAERLMGGTDGGVTLAVAYFLPVAHALTPVLAGTLNMPYRRFVGWAMTGAAAWVTFYVVIGAVAGSAARQHQDLLVPLTAAVAVLVGGTVLAIRRFTAARLSRGREHALSGPFSRDHGLW